jgi:hypothetical protein
MKVRCILYLLCFVLVAAVASIFFLWNKAPASASGKKGIPIAAVELCQQYESDEALADKNYIGQWLEIKGSIKEVGKNQQNNTVAVLLGTELGSVMCTFANNIVEVKKGTKVTVNGFCNGYLMPDVRIDRCTLKKE